MLTTRIDPVRLLKHMTKELYKRGNDSSVGRCRYLNVRVQYHKMDKTRRNIQIDNESSIECFSINGIEYYCAIDIGNILKMANIRGTLANLSKQYKTTCIRQTSSGERGVTVLTKEGVQHLLSKSRSMYVSRLTPFFDLETVKIRPPIEIATLTQITTAFAGENMKHQYTILRFKLDLYFEDYKLAIECDETHHKKHAAKDVEREELISDVLNCTFIRYNPTEDDFNIFTVINRIYLHIKEYKKL